MGIASLTGRLGNMIAPFTATVVCTLYSCVKLYLKLRLNSFVVFSELTFTFAICCRPPSVVCLSVTFLRPTQLVEIFGNVSTPFCTLAIR